jgi:cupin 2 domain-containing protein
MQRTDGGAPVHNLFADIPEGLPEEQLETLIEHGTFRLERIVSAGHATPPGQWYDQDRDEWVVLLCGSAGLLFEGQAKAQTLRPGDAVLIPSHRRHRVEWTKAGKPTVWLALHFDAD